jgi:Fe-S cluster assembly protein SufD
MSGTASIDATAWAARLRGDARQRFDALGIPKPTEEDWRQTNVLPLASFAATVAEAAALPADWERRAPYTAAAIRLVLVNGRIDARASRLDSLPDGVRVTSLAAAMAAPDATLERTFATAASVDDRPFVALNTALFVDGASITVAPDVEVSDPGSRRPRRDAGCGAGCDSRAHAHPRGPESRLTVVESFVSAGDASYLTNAVTEVVLEPNAHVEHVKIQDENRAAWHVATVACLQAKDARFHSHNVSLGARLARNDIGSRLGGEGAECHLYGLYSPTVSNTWTTTRRSIMPRRTARVGRCTKACWPAEPEPSSTEESSCVRARRRPMPSSPTRISCCPTAPSSHAPAARDLRE